MEKKLLWQGFGKNKVTNIVKHPLCKALVTAWAKVKKNTLFGRVLARIRTKIR